MDDERSTAGELSILALLELIRDPRAAKRQLEAFQAERLAVAEAKDGLARERSEFEAFKAATEKAFTERQRELTDGIKEHNRIGAALNREIGGLVSRGLLKLDSFARPMEANPFEHTHDEVTVPHGDGRTIRSAT